MPRSRGRKDEPESWDEWDDDEPPRPSYSDGPPDDQPAKTWRILGVLGGMFLGLCSGFTGLAAKATDDLAFSIGYLMPGVLIGGVIGWLVGRHFDKSAWESRQR